MNSIHLLKNLVSIRSVEGNMVAMKEIIDLCLLQLERLGLKSKLYESNGVYSLLIAKEIKTTYKILLNGHLDVVEGPDALFIPTVKNGRLYGRGASDMKGPVAVMFDLLPDIYDSDTALLLTTDEEVGGFDGVGFVTSKIGVNAKYVIVPDTDPSYKVLRSAKGACHMLLRYKGKSVHASEPWNGDNSITKMMLILEEISKKVGSYSVDPKSGISLTVSKIEGGNSVNMVPDLCKAYIDVRFRTLTEYCFLKKVIENSIRKYKCLKMEELVFANPLINDVSSNEYKELENILKKNGVDYIEYIDDLGTSDARYFASTDTKVFSFNPIGGGIHENGEWVSINDLERFRKVLYEFVLYLKRSQAI